MKKGRLKRFIKASLVIFIIFLVLFNVLFYLIRRPDVQTYLTQKAAEIITSTTGAPASVGMVDLRPRKIILKDDVINYKYCSSFDNYSNQSWTQASLHCRNRACGKVPDYKVASLRLRDCHTARIPAIRIHHSTPATSLGRDQRHPGPGANLRGLAPDHGRAVRVPSLAHSPLGR